MNQIRSVNQLARFAKSHQLIIGLLLTVFAVADLWFVMTNTWSSAENWQGGFIMMPQWNIAMPTLLIAGLIGTLTLSAYSIKGIKPRINDSKKYAAITAGIFAFTYIVIGAWPLWNQPYPWPWQQQIANYGNILVLPLFAGSLIALIVGATSLYIHSNLAPKIT